jgi:hypothetical protein
MDQLLHRAAQPRTRPAVDALSGRGLWLAQHAGKLACTIVTPTCTISPPAAADDIRAGQLNQLNSLRAATAAPSPAQAAPHRGPHGRSGEARGAVLLDVHRDRPVVQPESVSKTRTRCASADTRG